MKRLLYKPLGMLVTTLGGLLAGAIFRRAWKLILGEDETPAATDAQRGWRETLVAAALNGAIFAAVGAAISRGLAEGSRTLTERFRKLTGGRPKEGAEPSGGSAGGSRP